MARFVHPSIDDITLTGILEGLADPLRLQILVRLLDQDEDGFLSCCQSAPCPKIAKSTLSNHFRILRESGLIRMTKHGVENHSVVRLDEINKKFPGLIKAVLKHVD